jgi:DNA repair protein RecO (recombination protein O)
MSTYYKTIGFVLKKDERDEADRVFTLFTKDFGRLEIFAKAIRKIASKLKSGIDIFSFSEVEFIQGKTYKTLTDAVLINKLNNIKSSPEKFEIALRIANILNDFLKGSEKDSGTFELINEVFDIFENLKIENKKLEILYYYFLWNFLSLQGYRPELEKCVSCKNKLNPYGIYFSSKDGGILCRRCVMLDQNFQKLNSDVVKILRLIIKKDWQTLIKLKIRESSKELFQKISDNYYYFLLPK